QCRRHGIWVELRFHPYIPSRTGRNNTGVSVSTHIPSLTGLELAPKKNVESDERVTIEANSQL
ncbi:MAG TPA: hypothetical protein PKA39_14665, partial [Ignavibacteria bacterium]|nr:hypothetical protein [Ignavibacteria bacterium]